MSTNAITAAKIDANAVTAQKLAAVSIEAGKYIRSTSYSAGSAGWSIDADGTAEFNNVTVRGALDGVTGSYAGQLTAQNVDLSAGGRLVLRPGAFYAYGAIDWLDNSNALMAQVRVSGTGASAPLDITTSGSRSIDFAPNGAFRMGINAGALPAATTGIVVQVGSGPFAGQRTLKVDGGGYLYVT